MLKSIVTICVSVLAADAVSTYRHNHQIKVRQAQKTKPSSSPKKDEALKSWHLRNASSQVAHREWKGDYIGLAADQKIVDLDFELIIARSF